MATNYEVLSGDDIFETIHRFTAYWERDFGELTDSKIDRGGLTKNGVSIELLKSLNLDLNADGTINKLDVLKCTPEVAKKIFYAEFWTNGRAYCCPPLTAMVYYDFSVNSGAGTAALQMQKAIDSIKPGTIVNYAANLGPKTRTALKELHSTEKKKSKDYDLAIALLKRREDYCRAIAANNTQQKGNLAGWLNRINDLSKFINTIHFYY